MKNSLKSYTIAVMFCMVAFSCKKSDDATDIADLPYANETVSQGKTSIDSTGQLLVTQLSTMADVSGVSSANNMSYFIDLQDPFSNSIASSTAFASVRTTSTLGTSQNIGGVTSFLSANVQAANDSTAKQLFVKYCGTYTWNVAKKVWVKTTLANKIVLVFPSTKIGTVDNASFELTYSSKIGSSIVDALYSELPLNVLATLNVDNVKVLEYSFTAQYDSNSNPTKIDTYLALPPFKFEAIVNNNISTSSVQYLFTNNSQTIMDFYIGLNGNFSQTAIDTSSSEDYVISNANAYFQIFNLKLSGRIDVKGLYQKVSEISDNATKKDANQLEVDAMNQNIALVLMYADSKKKIAQSEFYATTKISSYFNGVSNVSVMDYSSDIRFIFTDESAVSLKAYFGEGFIGAVTDFNTLLIKLNAKYSLGAGSVSY